MARLGRSQPVRPLIRSLRFYTGIYTQGIASDEAFGTATMVLDIATAGIAAIDAGGLPYELPFGLGGVDRFGIGIVAESQDISFTGIESAEEFGTGALVLDIATTGIESAEVFGTAIIAYGITSDGIESAEVFGTAVLVLDITSAGIGSGEMFGAGFVGQNQVIAPPGIPSALFFGSGIVWDRTLREQAAARGGAADSQIAPSDAQDFILALASDQVTAITAADKAAKIQLSAPTNILVTLYDKVYRVRGECNDYISLQAAFPRHLVETGQLVMKGDDALAIHALKCHEEVVPVTIDIGRMCWSGRIKVAKDRFGFKGEADTVICELEGDRAWLLKILAWPDFLMPIQAQFPPRGVAIGPAISVIRWIIATQTFRIQAGLWDLINNLGSLNLDWRSWFGTFLMQDVLGPDGQFDFSDIMRMLRTPIYVCKTNLAGAVGGVLGDTSPFISVNWRMDKIYDLVDQIVKDNGLVVEVNLWRPGDPQPDTGMLFPLTVPTIVVDVKDRMGIVGPTHTFFDGILRTLIDLQDSIFGEITKPFLNPYNEPVPEGFNIAPALGLHFVPPWVLFLADQPQSGCWGEIAHHHPLAWRTVIGGHSPKWLNDLINATLSWILDSIMIIVGLTGVPSNLLDGLFNDILLAFALADNMDRRIKGGPYSYPEWFAPTGHSPYNIDGVFALKREQWNTRGYVSGMVYFDNGYPYEIGRDLFVGSMASLVRRGKVYTDFVENIIIEDTRQELKATVQIGDGIAEEPAVVKTYRNLVKAMEAINVLTLSTQ